MSTAFAAPKVGRQEAERFFQEDAKELKQMRRETNHVLMLHVGQATSSQSYDWKVSGRLDGVAHASYGVTYLFDQWWGMDANIRLDFNEYNLLGTRATKLSLLPLVTFPDASTQFPLYFGMGAGLGGKNHDSK